MRRDIAAMACKKRRTRRDKEGCGITWTNEKPFGNENAQKKSCAECCAHRTHQTSTVHLDASVGSVCVCVCAYVVNIIVTPRANFLRKADPSWWKPSRKNNSLASAGLEASNVLQGGAGPPTNQDFLLAMACPSYVSATLPSPLDTMLPAAVQRLHLAWVVGSCRPGLLKRPLWPPHGQSWPPAEIQTMTWYGDSNCYSRRVCMELASSGPFLLRT